MLLLPPFSPSRTHTKKRQHSSDFFNGGTAAFFSYYIRHADTTLLNSTVHSEKREELKRKGGVEFLAQFCVLFDVLSISHTLIITLN